MLAYTKEQKIAFATYMMEVYAELWWVSTKRLLDGAQTHIA